MPRKPIAPVVRENGVWTYAAPMPTDFFTRAAYMDAMIAYYRECAPEPTPICR